MLTVYVIAPTELTLSPSLSPSKFPSLFPTRSPTVDTDPCGDDRKEWEIMFPCAGQPIFELVSTCDTAFAVRLSLDKVWEVDLDRRTCGNNIYSWGSKGKHYWKKDLDFVWDGGNFGNVTGLLTVDDEEREVIRNQFSAKLKNRVRGYGGKKCKRDAWFNVTVFFFVDERGGTFDLRNTGNEDDYVTVEPYTLKYIIDAKNWPFKRKSDQLAVQFTASLIQIEDGYSPDLDECKPYKKDKSYGGGGGGYKGKGTKGSYGKKKKGKKKGNKGNPYKRRRMNEVDIAPDAISGYESGNDGGRELLFWKNEWRRNEKQKSNNDDDGWGNSKGVAVSFAKNLAAFIFNFAFEVDFRMENLIIALIDGIVKKCETVNEEVAADHIVYTHYFDRFETLKFDGACIYYKPTFDYWESQHETQTKTLEIEGGSSDHAAFGGEDVNSDPNFKTQPVDDNNGFFTELWESMTWQYWVIAICAAILLCCMVHCCCGYLCKKKKQNTHENGSFIQLQ